MTTYSGDTFSVSGGNSPVIGDTEVLGFGDVGGDDSFYGANGGSGYVAYGDAYELTSNARGGDDYMSAGWSVSGGGSIIPAAVTIAAPLPFFISGGVQFAGDAQDMYGSSRGGDDALVGGVNSDTVFIGDAAGSMNDRTQGGDDWISGSQAMDDSVGNIVIGDAYAFGDAFGPRLDSASLVHASVRLPMMTSVAGGSDELYGGDAVGISSPASVSNLVMGDAYALLGSSKGGADYISGGSATVNLAGGADADALNFLAGDGYGIAGRTNGGSDEIIGGDANQGAGGDAYAINLIAGDALFLQGNGRMGADSLSGGDSNALAGYVDGMGAVALNLMAGDGFMADGSMTLGNDTLTGGSGVMSSDGYAVNVMYGDIGDTSFVFGPPSFATVGSSGVGAEFVDLASAIPAAAASGPSSSRMPVPKYGADVLTGGDGQAQNFMVGDAEELMGRAKGGNDTITGGGWGSENVMVGDAAVIDASARGGNDVLISGEGNDTMYGDAFDALMGRGGADKFVFVPGNGNDIIMDFSRAQGDVINLHGFAEDPDFHSLATLLASGRVEESGDGVVIYLDVSRDLAAESRGDTLTIVGLSPADLKSAMFVF